MTCTFRLFFLLFFTLISQSANAHEYHRAAVDSLPTEIPDRVMLTWSDDPATSASVTWRTHTAIDTAFGEIAIADASANFTTYRTIVKAKTELWQKDEHAAHFHSVTFKDLKPNTLYAYRVGSGDIWSSWYQFKTAQNKQAPFTFIYFGDAQNNLLALWARAIRSAILDAPNANFLLHAGDLINRANADGEWQEWFESGDWIHAQIPAIATPGNHEYTRLVKDGPRVLSSLWRPHFTLPENGPKGFEETAYYIDYQGARIISLNSNEDRTAQAPWLEKVLKNNPNRWTFVTFHHPVYSASDGRDNESLREAWKPLFDKYKVDLVLQGHDHTYARGNNIGEGVTVKDPKNGTMYVVSVSGPKQYKLREDRWMTRGAENSQLYQVISVSRDTLHYRAMTVVGELYDAFDLVKQKNKPNKLIERIPSNKPERRWENTLEKKDKDEKVY